MKKVVVTGANIFIDKPLVEELVKSDCFVYAVIRERPSIKFEIENVKMKDVNL